MAKSGQENCGYTSQNGGLSADRSTFQAVLAHRHPPSSDSFVRPASVANGHRLATTLAADGPIGCQTRLSSHDFPSRQLFGNVCAHAEVHFLRRLAMKRSMREMLVVLVDLERDELLHRCQGIEAFSGTATDA